MNLTDEQILEEWRRPEIQGIAERDSIILFAKNIVTANSKRTVRQVVLDPTGTVWGSNEQEFSKYVADGCPVFDLVEVPAKKEVPWPYGATVKIGWDGYGPCPSDPVGYAKRDAEGDLVSAYSLQKLDQKAWIVIDERDPQST